MKKLINLTLLLSLIIINGCKREQVINEKSALSRNELTVLDNTKINISSPALSLDLEPFSELTQTQIQNLDEIQAADLLQPAVESGTILYNELMAQVVGTQAWSALTYMERDYIQNFTPQQKAMLAILYEAETNVASASSNSKWVNCALGALGVEQAVGLFTRSFITGMTATSALQILKFVGLRYLGYIALAVAAYEFTECVSSDATGPQQQLVVKHLDSYLLPSLPEPPTMSIGYCTTVEAVLDTVNDLWLDTPIFLNPIDNKYYVDSSYTTFVPDGYYSPPHIQAVVYKIIEGVSIAAYTIEPI